MHADANVAVCGVDLIGGGGGLGLRGDEGQCCHGGG